MIDFKQWMEMANLFPQRKGDTTSRTKTTHMGYPVYSPTIFFLILNRDKGKYQDGMTAQEIGDELLKASVAREELRPGEGSAPSDWEAQIRADKTRWAKFVRGINSMLAKSKDFVAVGTRARSGSGRGRAPSIYSPTPDAVRREGGLKFLKQADREFWKKERADLPVPGEKEPEEPEELADLPDDAGEKSDAEVAQMLQSMFED